MKKFKTKIGAKISTETKLLLSTMMVLAGMGFIGLANGFVTHQAKPYKEQIIKHEKQITENENFAEALIGYMKTPPIMRGASGCGNACKVGSGCVSGCPCAPYSGLPGWGTCTGKPPKEIE